MVQMIIENPSLLKESMTFTTERAMFDWYFSIIDDVDFREESDLPETMVQRILANKNKDVLYTNI